MRLHILASGSAGNCALIQGADGSVVIDAGITIKRLQQKLGKIPDRGTVHGIILTHGHGDHAGHAGPFSRYFNCPIFISNAAFDSLGMDTVQRAVRVGIFVPNDSFLLGPFTVSTYPVPHSSGAVALGIAENGKSIGWVSDCGGLTAGLSVLAAEVSVLAVEANYSLSVLRQCVEYDDRLKKRISGGNGHLSNEQAASLVAKGRESGKMHTAVLMHLSEHSNFPELALETARLQAGDRIKILIAGRDGAESVEV